MRTTVRLDESLMRSVKSYAAENGRTLTSVVEDALRRLLNEELHRDAGASPVDVVVFTGSGTRPGIEIDDRGTWQHLMDEEDAEGIRARANAGS